MRPLLLLCGLATSLLLGCSGDATIRCHDASDCHQGNIPGTCEPSPVSSDEWCAFTDTTCAGSMQRWGVASGDGLAGECVASGAADAGREDDAAGPDAAPPCTVLGASCNRNALERCESGHALPAEACVLGCVAGTATAEAHCKRIVPTDVDDACAADATAASYQASGTATVFDTDDGASCNGGIVVPAAGPAICVLRFGRFDIPASASVKVTGSRALAIVVDHDLTIEGTLDASGNGSARGPGAQATNGHGGGSFAGAGGGGFATPGGAGGSVSGGAAGGAGGPPVSIQAFASLSGGFAGASPAGGCTSTPGGGGGGGVALVSCRGVVSLGGIIDLGGGGGAHGQAGGQFPPCGGAGGGTGGLLNVQGAGIRVEGEVYANGGGGGSGYAGDGQDGEDGTRSMTVPASGGSLPGVALGGSGGIGQMAPLSAGSGMGTSNTAAGGGGAAGQLQLFVPAGVTADLDGARTSPLFDAARAIPTH